MKCPNASCGKVIPDDSMFCPDCGEPIKLNSIVPKTIERLKHLNLEPTNLINWKKPRKGYLKIIPLCILWGLVVFSPLTLCLVWFKMYPRKKDPLHSIADYVEDYVNDTTFFGDSKYVIFVKDGKCGVLDIKKCKVAIEAKYSNMSWRDKNKYLNVFDGEEAYVIDIHGEKLE